MSRRCIIATSLHCLAFMFLCYRLENSYQSSISILYFCACGLKGLLVCSLFIIQASLWSGRNENVAEMNCASFIFFSSLLSVFFSFMRENIARIWQRSFFFLRACLLARKWGDQFTHLLESKAKRFTALRPTSCTFRCTCCVNNSCSWCLLSYHVSFLSSFFHSYIFLLLSFGLVRRNMEWDEGDFASDLLFRCQCQVWCVFWRGNSGHFSRSYL